jgi:manganese transport protein
VATSFLLLIAVTAAVHFRYRRVSAELIPGRFFDAWLRISSLAIAFMGVYGIIAPLA